MEIKRARYTGIAPAFEASNNLFCSSLREPLVAEQEFSESDSMQPYVPEGALCTLIRHHVKHDHLSGEHANFVLFHARRIYCILIYLHLIKKLDDFLKCDFCDPQLPVEFNMHTGDVFTTGFHVVSAKGEILTTGELSEKQAQLFSSWIPLEIREFCDV